MLSISLHCDSQEIIFKVFSKIYNEKSKHISLRHEYIRQLIFGEIISIEYVKSCNNLANPFIKDLLKDLVRSTYVSMSLRLFN